MLMIGCKGLIGSWSGTLWSSISKGNSGSFHELQLCILLKINFLRLEHYWEGNISYIPQIFSKQWWEQVIYMKFYQLQQLTINVYQHSLPLRMANTWIKTKFHLTPLSQGSSLTIKCKEWSSNRGVIHWWHLSHHNVQCLYCILRYFAILFSTQKVVKFQKTYCCSKLNFNLVG